MVQRCTNCGAAVRPGAKFCTSCGTRLNLDQASAQGSGSPWGQPSATDETLVATPAVTPETSEQPEGETATTAATDTDAAGSIVSEDDTSAQQGADAVTGSPWRWGSSSTSMESESTSSTSETDTGGEEITTSSSTSGGTWTWGQRSQPSDETATEETSGEPTEEPAAASQPAWTSRWPSTSDADETASAWTTGERVEEMPAEAVEDTPAATTIDETPEDAAPADELTSAATSWTWGETTSSEDATAAGTTGGDQVDEETFTLVDSAAMEEEINPATALAEDARERAAALIDELRRLIPQIGDAGAASTAATGQYGDVADALSRARDEAGEFSGLRRTLESARDYPRDVDTMLELVSRADRLLALLDSYDRLTSAIDDAVGTLRRS